MSGQTHPEQSVSAPLSYTAETIARSPNDEGYFERREVLYLALHRHGLATSRELADELGWNVREVAAKLKSLARDGMADYEGAGEWSDPWDGE